MADFLLHSHKFIERHCDIHIHKKGKMKKKVFKLFKINQIYSV